MDLQAAVLAGQNARKEDLQTKIVRLRAALKHKEGQLKAAKKANSSLMQQVNDLTKKNKALKIELAEQKDTSQNHMNILNQLFNALLVDRKGRYLRQGTDSFRCMFLHTPAGQEFLRVLHEGLLSEYIKTREFMDAAASGLNRLIKRIEATEEQRGKLDTTTFVDEMKILELEGPMGINADLPEDWWISIMERAAWILVEANNSTPRLLPIGDLWYDLPNLKSLLPEGNEDVRATRGLSPPTVLALALADEGRPETRSDTGARAPESEPGGNMLTRDAGAVQSTERPEPSVDAGPEESALGSDNNSHTA